MTLKPVKEFPITFNDRLVGRGVVDQEGRVSFDIQDPELIRAIVDDSLRYLSIGYGAVKPKTENPPSNLVDHARRELELIGEEPETIEGYLKVIQAFADMGHSGGSASVVIPVINQLLQFKNLKPLTDNPKEWIDHGDCWQNCRNSEAFSEDGGKTYTLLSERKKAPDNDGWYPVHNSQKSGA